MLPLPLLTAAIRRDPPMSPVKEDTTPVAYSRALPDLRMGDVVLLRARRWSWNPRSWKGAAIGSLITWAGRSHYSHAGMLVKVRGEWFVAEMVESVGGRLWPLRKYAESHPGDVDVFRVTSRRYKWSGATDKMIAFVGEPYGWWAVAKAAALHLPFVRHVAKRVAREAPWKGPLYCSAAVAWAMQYGGNVDPVGDLNPEHTEPGDLARATVINDGYLFSITPDEQTKGPAALSIVAPLAPFAFMD